MAITSAPEQLASPARLRLGRPGEGSVQARTGELYARHARTVTGLCRGLLRDRSEAEDAVQQVFLSAHRALLNGSAPREPGAWLAAIARNECLSRIRSRMREPLPSAEIEAESPLPDPLAEAIRRADLAALWRVVEQLPRRQRHALLLREFGGLSYEELALALGVSRPTVESLLFRARHALRDRLRAVYAAVSGASWLDAVARLLAGGSGAAAPAAAKAVAVGLGAAVVTGGAVVAPTIAHHGGRAAATAARQPGAPTATPSHRSAPHERTPSDAAAPARARTVVPAARSHRGPRPGRHGDGGATTSVTGRPAEDGSGDPQAVPTGSTPSGGSGTQSSDGGRSSPSGGGSGGSGDSGQSGDGPHTSGDGGGSSGGGGGSVAPTTQLTTTGSGGDGSSGGTSTGETSGGGSSGTGGSDNGTSSTVTFESGSSGSGSSGSGDGGTSGGGSSDGGSGGGSGGSGSGDGGS